VKQPHKESQPIELLNYETPSIDSGDEANKPNSSFD